MFCTWVSLALSASPPQAVAGNSPVTSDKFLTAVHNVRIGKTLRQSQQSLAQQRSAACTLEELRGIGGATSVMSGVSMLQVTPQVTTWAPI